MIALLLAAAAGAAPSTGTAADEVRAEASADAVRLGEPFQLSLALRHSPGERAALAPLPPLGPFGLREAACRTTPGERSALAVCALSLQLFDLGPQLVPPIELIVQGPGGERRASAPAVPVRGLGTTDPTRPAEALALREPVPPPLVVPSLGPLRWAAAALAALLAALLLRRGLRRRQRAILAAPPLPPAELLSRRVGEILALDLPRRGRGREHVDRLAEAVRDYLAAAGATRDRTSAEILEALAARPAPGLDPAALVRFLGAADLVKFARHEPAAPECEAASAFARDLAARAGPPRPAGRAA